jgi:hypothetical protein
MLQENVNSIIDFYLKELAQYPFGQIRQKPSPTSWSLVQMYLHLIYDTQSTLIR